MSKLKVKSKKSDSEFYVDPEQMWNSIVAYYEDDKIVPSDVAKNIQDIAEKLSYMGNFMNYSWRHDMVGDATLKMMEALVGKKFKPWKDEIVLDEDEIITNNKEIMIKREGEWRKLRKDERLFGNKLVIKNNAFSYYTKIAYHAFLNRLKKENKMREGIKEYQEKVWEDYMNSGNGWENVKRMKNNECGDDDDCVDFS